jgi:CheY-like chemotaxis protein
LSGQVILVVDDIDINRRLMVALLTQAGYQVATCPGGAEAVEAVAVGDYGLVLMDVRMPGTDGPAATRQIRALPGDRGRIPILGLTATDNDDQILACRAAGMDAVISKPINVEALLGEIARRIGARAAYDPAEDPDLKALRDRYAAHLAALRPDFARALRSLETDPSLSDLAARAHSIIGSAGNLGFAAASEAARAVEAAALAGDLALARAVLAQLIESLPEPQAD